MLMASEGRDEGSSKAGASCLFTANFPSPEQIRADIEKEGFAVYPDAIDTECVARLRQFWTKEYRWERPKAEVVRGELALGERDFLSYTKSSYWCLYRHFGFPWNEPLHALTSKIGIEIHKVRNQAQGFNADYGLTYSPDRYGVYISTSWYEPNRGHLTMHTDGHKDVPILQYMLPITHKHIDFDGGGLVLQVGDGPVIDVDSLMKPGSIVFFDARNNHGVETILCSKPDMIGRIASFAIPTFYVCQDEIPTTIRKMHKGYNWIKRKLRRISGAKY